MFGSLTQSKLAAGFGAFLTRPRAILALAAVAILVAAGLVAASLAPGQAGVASAHPDVDVVISTDALTIVEGKWKYYTVKLDKQPAADVTVTVTASSDVISVKNGDETDYKASTELTFSTFTCPYNYVTDPDPCAGKNAWNRQQYVDVAAARNDTDGGGAATVSHRIGAEASDQSVAVTTKDPAAMIITKPDGTPLTIKDINDNDFLGMYVANSGTASFLVSVNCPPTTDLTINVSKHYDRRGTISFDTDASSEGNQTTLTFTKDNYNTPQTVTVKSSGPVPGRNGSAVIRLRSAPDTKDEVFRQLVWSDVRVREFDPPAILVSPNPLTVNEGSAASYGVRLHTKPTANVTVTLAEDTGTSDDHDLTVTSSKTLTFTPANYKTSQNVTVAAAPDDDLVNGSRVITHTAASTDADYAGLAAKLTARENDTDTPSIVVSANAVTVPEGGSATYTVKLSNLPSGDVTVDITPSSTSGGGDDDITLAPESLTFTAADWNAAQTVTLSAAPDGDDLNGTNTISHTATGAEFNNLRVVVTATEGDDDQRGFIVNPAPGPVTIAEGGSTTYTVKLGTQPTHGVTVAIASSGDSDITVAPASLTFRTTDYSTAQTVTISAAEDDTDYADDTATISHTVTTTDPIYTEQTIGDIAVTATDDDAAIILSTSAVTVPKTTRQPTPSSSAARPRPTSPSPLPKAPPRPTTTATLRSAARRTRR